MTANIELPSESRELARARNSELALAEAVAAGKVKMTDILKAIGVEPNNPTHQAALLACDKYGLDPLMKHIVVIPRAGPYITRDGWLHIAHRSGQFDGMDVIEQGETPTHWTAKVGVYRKDMGHPFTYLGRYPKGGSNKTYGPEMAVKVAEVAALRRAFPVDGVGAYEERWEHTAMSDHVPVSVAEITEQVAVAQWHDDNPPDNVDIETGEILELGQ
jgi:hypothetical protein